VAKAAVHTRDAPVALLVGDYSDAAITRIPVFVHALYKSLFTENSVATQKHSSTSINTNKIQYKIQRSSPSQ